MQTLMLNTSLQKEKEEEYHKEEDIPTPPSLPRIVPSPPSTPRPPRPRPLRRYTGMNNLTKIQKGGAFTREMGKKLFLNKLTRASRPTVTKTSKPKKETKKT